MKRTEQKAPKMEFASGAVILFSIFLSLFVNYLGVLNTREAVQTAAGVQQEPEEYTQLSDPLLVLVNDRVPLPENWVVTPKMIDDEQVDLRAYQDLSEMFAAAAKDDVWFWVVSGYRSVEQQEIVLERAIRENMENGLSREEAEQDALRTVARPGYSEHHTGLAVDLNDVSDEFEESKAYRWLSVHAAEYGFVQRYQKSKTAFTGIDRESWHYRYVGKKHAKEMKRLDFCLEEYVEYLKNQGIS